MPRLLAAALAVLFLGLNSTSAANTLDELRRENDRLMARIAHLERRLEQPMGDGGFDYVPRDDARGDHHDHHGHNHHGDHAADCDCYDPCCDPHFDYCLRYHDTHGGHGNCNLNRYWSVNGGHGHDHGHGHDLDYGPAYHHSIDGYPLLHSPRTEFIFIERHVHLVCADARGADGGDVDEFEFEAELVYALNDRWVVIGAVPVIHLNPDADPSTTGIGDMEFGVRFMAFNGERDGVLFGMNVTTPTGDGDRDLGGTTAILPSAGWIHDFGCGNYVFNIVTWEIPIDVDAPEDVLLHDFVFSHTFLGTQDNRFFRYLTANFELNTEAVLNGVGSGSAVVDTTVGLTWVSGRDNEVSIGWSTPLSGDRNFNSLMLFNFIKHL